MQKQAIAPGEYFVHSALYQFNKYEVGYVTAQEERNADLSNIKYSYIAIDDLVAFVEQEGGLLFGVDQEGQPVICRYDPPIPRKYVFGNRHEVIKRYLDAGKGLAYEK